MRIGVISDTHGLMRHEALAALDGSDLILHAGDVGNEGVLDALRAIAPVTAIRGNNDAGSWADALPEREVVAVGSLLIYMIHDVGRLDLDPVAAGFAVVVSGHSHEPSVESRRGVTYLNPGSAGPRRFTLPIALARLDVGDGDPRAEIVVLQRFDQKPAGDSRSE